MSRHVVGRAADLGDGERLIVDVAGRSIGIFRVGGRLYGLRNRCPHAGGELCRGRLVGRLSSPRPGQYIHDASRPLLACPWHGWEFDLATGQSYVDPRRLRVRAYDVRSLAGETLAGEALAGEADQAPTAGPYRAQTIPVGEQDEYLVVTLGEAGD